MKYMTVKGEKLSQLGLGTWNMGEKAEKRDAEIEAIRCGLASGVNVIDTAEMYGEGRAESLVGEAIRDLDRSQLFLISKFYPWHASPDDQKKSLAASLKRLGDRLSGLVPFALEERLSFSRNRQGPAGFASCRPDPPLGRLQL